MRTFDRFLVVLAIALTARSASAAGPPTPTPAPAPPTAAASSSAAAQDDDDDAALQPAEPEFRIINLPTTMRLPLFKGNFDLTHRFAGNLRRGSFSDQAGRLFGIDDGATVGFGYRFAIA